jgi:hypothetical protein
MRHPAEQIIRALEDDVDCRRSDRQLRIAGAIEDGLHLVGEFLYFPEFQEPGQPIDRVKTAKDRVQSFRVERIAPDRQGLRLNAGEMLAALEHKIAHQFGVLRRQQVVRGDPLRVDFDGLLETDDAILQFGGDAIGFGRGPGPSGPRMASMNAPAARTTSSARSRCAFSWIRSRACIQADGEVSDSPMTSLRAKSSIWRRNSADWGMAKPLRSRLRSHRAGRLCVRGLPPSLAPWQSCDPFWTGCSRGRHRSDGLDRR